MADCRIKNTRGGCTSNYIFYTAPVAANTFLIRSIIFDFFNIFRLDEERSGASHKISKVFGQYFLGNFRAVDTVARNNRNFYHLLDGSGKKCKSSGRQMIGNLRNTCLMPAACNIKGINIRFCQSGKVLHILQSISPEHVTSGNSDNNGLVRTHSRSHCFCYIQRKSAPVFKAASIFIISEIGKRGKKFGQQVSCAGRYFQYINTAFF